MAKSTKKSKNQTEQAIKQDSVLYDEALNIDVQSDDVEVLADDVHLDNEAVSVAAVIKNSHHDEQHESVQTDLQSDSNATKDDLKQDDSKTKVFDERVEQVLGDDKKEHKDKADIKDDIKNTVNDVKETVKQTVDNAQTTVKEELEHIKTDVKDRVESISQEIADKSKQLGERTSALKEDLTHRAEDVAHDIKDKLDDAKDKLDDVKFKLEDGKDKLAQKTEELTADLTDKKDELLDEINARNEQAIKDAKAYKKVHKKGALATRLGMMGAYLGSLYHAKADYAPANLDDNSKSDIFHRQGSQLVENVLGPKAVSAHSLAKKIVPQSKMDAISEFAYEKIANWAQKWAAIELKSDERFQQLAALSEGQKSAFVDDIANQNRVLATFGGVTGFLGLKGVVIDTAWLLLISLKSIYQLAMIYDKPLIGKAGVKTAYGILSACDLDKLQDKQLIMTALALGNVVLANAQSTSVADELQKLGQKYQNRSYTKGFEELSKFVDLDNLNPSWLHWLLPTTSTAISAHYNNELITEVLGVTKATFAPVQAPKLLENKA